VDLPLILLCGVVLFPGETLPLRQYNQSYVRWGPAPTRVTPFSPLRALP
jgi:hypothetical protein